jgi:ankyrin repeat protein
MSNRSHQENTMQDPQQAQPGQAVTDDYEEETLALARKVFQFARVGETEDLAAYLARGLPPNLRNERGDTLLMLACYHGHVDTARVLLTHGADPEIPNDAGQTPLAGAAFKGDTAVATLLLEHGVLVDNAGPNGMTALMFAAMFNRVEMVQLLLAHGADPLRADAQGNSIIAAARKMGATDTADMLAGLTDEHRIDGSAATS